METKQLLIAFVGMPGSGKTEATTYAHTHGFPFVRFGDITEEGLVEKGRAVTPENEQRFRETLRKELGMAAYAILSTPKIEKLLKTACVVIIDGLYSWAEYIYIKEKFPSLLLIHLYAQPPIRYARLAKRSIRPFSFEQAQERDRAEIEKLDKGGPIAIADFMIENNDDDMTHLHEKIAITLRKMGVAI